MNDTELLLRRIFGNLPIKLNRTNLTKDELIIIVTLLRKYVTLNQYNQLLSNFSEASVRKYVNQLVEKKVLKLHGVKGFGRVSAYSLTDSARGGALELIYSLINAPKEDVDNILYSVASLGYLNDVPNIAGGTHHTYINDLYFYLITSLDLPFQYIQEQPVMANGEIVAKPEIRNVLQNKTLVADGAYTLYGIANEQGSKYNHRMFLEQDMCTQSRSDIRAKFQNYTNTIFDQGNANRYPNEHEVVVQIHVDRSKLSQKKKQAETVSPVIERELRLISADHRFVTMKQLVNYFKKNDLSHYSSYIGTRAFNELTSYVEHLSLSVEQRNQSVMTYFDSIEESKASDSNELTEAEYRRRRGLFYDYLSEHPIDNHLYAGVEFSFCNNENVKKGFRSTHIVELNLQMQYLKPICDIMDLKYAHSMTLTYFFGLKCIGFDHNFRCLVSAQTKGCTVEDKIVIVENITDSLSGRLRAKDLLLDDSQSYVYYMVFMADSLSEATKFLKSTLLPDDYRRRTYSYEAGVKNSPKKGKPIIMIYDEEKLLPLAYYPVFKDNGDIAYES